MPDKVTAAVIAGLGAGAAIVTESTAPAIAAAVIVTAIAVIEESEKKDK